MRGPCSGFDFSDKGYEVLRQIGTGQFGRALLVRQVKDNELRTAKIVDLSPLDATDAYLAAQETNLLRRVQDNPHIVSLCDHFIYQNIYLVIVMEYCQGGDMARCIRSMRWAGVRFKESEVIVMLRQLLLGLECIHDRSILHRDLKPSNILLTADGRLKIADFGVSRQLDFTLPNARTSIGTPQYMPPEMMMRRPYMFFSDMWSLGCVLYEMLTCRPAFDDAAPVQLAFRVCFTPPDAMEGPWSAQLRDIVHRLLSKEPEQRPKPSQLLSEPYLNGIPHPVTSAVPYQHNGRLSMVYETMDEDAEDDEGIAIAPLAMSEGECLSSSASIPELCSPTPTPKDPLRNCSSASPAIVGGFTSPPTRTSSVNGTPPPLSSHGPLVAGELMEFSHTPLETRSLVLAPPHSGASSATPSSSVSSCFRDETASPTSNIDDDLSYCELILHRVNLGLKTHQMPCAAAMLKAAGKWSLLNSMVENLTRAMCGGQDVGIVMRGNFHQNILLEIIRANVKPLWESTWSPTSNTEVDGALAESVTPEWLTSMSTEFGLGLSTAEGELLLKTVRMALKRPRVALRDFLPCMYPPGMLSYAYFHVIQGDAISHTEHPVVETTRADVELVFNHCAKALLDPRTQQLSPEIQASLPTSGLISPPQFLEVLTRVAHTRDEVAAAICKFALKTQSGDIDWKGTVGMISGRKASPTESGSPRARNTAVPQTSTSSIPDSHPSNSSQFQAANTYLEPAQSAAEPHQMLHSFYERGLIRDRLHHAQSDVVFTSRPSQRASAPSDDDESLSGDQRSSNYSRRLNGGSSPVLNTPSDTSPLSISRLTTSPAELLPLDLDQDDDFLPAAYPRPRRTTRRLPLTRAITTLDAQSYRSRTRRSRRRRPSNSSLDSASSHHQRPRLSRAILNPHAPLHKLRQTVRRMSSGEVRALPAYQGDDWQGLVMVFPDGSWMSQRPSTLEQDPAPADEDLLRAMLHSLKAHEKTTERIIRELQSLSAVQMQLQFAKSVGHEWLHMIRQIMHKTLEDQQHRLMQAEYALYPTDGPSWREQAARSIRDLSKALVQALRNVKGRLRALTVLLTPSVCSACDLVGGVGLECVKRFDRATLRVLDVLASMKPGVDAARFIEDAEARIRRRTYICAYPRTYLWGHGETVADASDHPPYKSADSFSGSAHRVPATGSVVDMDNSRRYDRWPPPPVREVATTQVLSHQRRTRFLIRHPALDPPSSAATATSSSSSDFESNDRRLTRATSMRYHRRRQY